MKILCITSLFWIKNIVRAFKNNKRSIGTLTTLNTCASVNLWRKYEFYSTRRKVDVLFARFTSVYYVWNTYVTRSTSNLLQTTKLLLITGTCYIGSKYNFFNWRFWHILFHLNVYRLQTHFLKY